MIMYILTAVVTRCLAPPESFLLSLAPTPEETEFIFMGIVNLYADNSLRRLGAVAIGRFCYCAAVC